MPSITLSLTEKQAQNIMVLVETKGTPSLAKLVAFQVNQGQRLIDQEREFAACGDVVKGLAQAILAALPTVTKRGMSQEVLTYARNINRVMERAEKTLEQALAAHRAALPKAQRDHAELSADQIDRVLFASKSALTRAHTTLTQALPRPMVAKGKDAAKRTKLAKLCVWSGADQAREVGGYGELDMVALFVGDMLRHIELGRALIAGRPKMIRDASSMDTGCRDGLNDDVWAFVNQARFY